MAEQSLHSARDGATTVGGPSVGSTTVGVTPVAGKTVGGTIAVTVRYFAAARAAAGVPEEHLAIPVGGGPDPDSTSADGLAAVCTVADVLQAAVERHGPGLDRILQRCSYLLAEVAVHGTATPVADGQVLDVLPPFAGG